MDILSHFGDKLRQRILKSGYETVELFAHENSIPKSTLSEILSGKNDPRLTTLYKICVALETTPSELLKDPSLDTWVREAQVNYTTRTRGRNAKKTRKRR